MKTKTLDAAAIGRLAILRTVLERAVTNELGIDTAVGCMVNVLKEYAIVCGTDLGSPLAGIHIQLHLRPGSQSCHCTYSQ